ncbi:MAG: hypothetical protein AABZ64_01385, partial [Nitrospinota bacterium]
MSHHPKSPPRAGDPPVYHVRNVGTIRLDLCHRQRVSLGARVLLSEVSTACFAFGAYMKSQRDVAARLGRSVRQVQRWTEELIGAGLVEKIRRGRKLSNGLKLSIGFFTKLARIVQHALPRKRREYGVFATMDGFLRDVYRRRV